jgi:hypothetical protein
MDHNIFYEGKRRINTMNDNHVVFLNNKMFRLYESDTSTGANIEFKQDNDSFVVVVHDGDTVFEEVCTEREFNIMDAVITWFLYPAEAYKMLKK